MPGDSPPVIDRSTVFASILFSTVFFLKIRGIHGMADHNSSPIAAECLWLNAAPVPGAAFIGHSPPRRPQLDNFKEHQQTHESTWLIPMSILLLCLLLFLISNYWFFNCFKHFCATLKNPLWGSRRKFIRGIFSCASTKNWTGGRMQLVSVPINHVWLDHVGSLWMHIPQTSWKQPETMDYIVIWIQIIPQSSKHIFFHTTWRWQSWQSWHGQPIQS